MKKLLIFFLCLGMTAAMFTGCGKQNEETTEQSATPPATIVTETTTEETTTEETTTEDPIPEGNEDLLTGLYNLPDEAVGTRPVAVAVNNVMSAMPQYGVSDADIIFEFPIEANETRLLAVFPSYKLVPYVVSIRSYRYYFPPFALGFDAFYIHWGEDTTMMDYYYSLDMDSFDGLGTYSFFGRDQARLNDGYALEHTSYFDGPTFAQYLENNGYRTTLADNYNSEAFCFNDNYEGLDEPQGDSCTYAKVHFGGQWATFTYNSSEGVYYKTNDDKAHVDGISGIQLNFTNLFFLETSVWTRDDGERKGVDWYGGEDSVGYYVSDGKVQQIRWSKENEYARLKFYDMDGNELVINRGKSYIAVCPYDSVTLQ